MEGEAASSEAAVTASAEGLASQVPTGNEPEKCMSEGDKAPAASQKHPRKRLKGVLKSVQDQVSARYVGLTTVRVLSTAGVLLWRCKLEKRQVSEGEDGPAS